MNLDNILKGLDTYLTHIQSPDTFEEIQLDDIAKLKTILDKIQQVPLIHNSEFTQNQKFILKQKESKIGYFEEISTIYEEVASEVDNFKSSYLGIEETMINNYNNLDDFKPKELVDDLIKLFLPVQNIFLISRSTSFKVWGFEKVKTDLFFPNMFFENIQNFHMDQEKDFDVLTWDDNMHKNCKKYVNLNTENLKTCSISFIIPQSEKVTETHVSYIFQVEEKNLENLRNFFEDNRFCNFTMGIFKGLYELCLLSREGSITKKDYKSSIDQLRRWVGINSLELLIFGIEENDSLTGAAITTRNVERLGNDFKTAKIIDYDINLIFDKENDFDNNKLMDLKCSLNKKFDDFIAFFEGRISDATELSVSKDSEYIILLDKQQRVVKFAYESPMWDEYFDHEKPYKTDQRLRYFISDDILFEKLKERVSFETQKQRKNENLKFDFENLVIDVLPLFVLGNNKTKNEIFGIRINKKDISHLLKMQYNIVIPGGVEEQESPKKESNENVKSIVKVPSNNIKKDSINKRVSFLQKQVSSIQDMAIVNDSQIDEEENETENSPSKIPINTNFNKLFLAKGNLEKMYSTIRGKIETKFAEMRSEEDLNKVMTQAFDTIPINNLKGTIVGEFINENLLDNPNGNSTYYDDNTKDRRVIVNNFFSSKKDIKSPKSENKDKKVELEIIEDEKLENYQLTFLNRRKNLLYNSVYTMFEKSGVISHFKVDLTRLKNLIVKADELYSQNKNTYHNFAHGVTVMNGCYYFLKKTELIDYFDDLGMAAFLFAAFMHDIDHSGSNNDFEIKSLSNLAITYNNKSVLENHHCSTAFKLLQRDEYNIFENLDRDDFQMFRTLVIEMILMTDLKNSVYNLNQFKTAVANFKDKTEFCQSESLKNFQLLTGNFLHCADIYGPARESKESDQWTDLILAEFDAQLIKEEKEGLPVTQFFRDNKNERGKIMNQIAFISSIVKPMWVVCDDFLKGGLNKELNCIEDNLELWNERLKELEEKEDKENK